MATDEYVINFATYVKNNLEPGRKIYIEYSNKVWNPDFSQSKWVLEQAKKTFPNSTETDFDLRMDWCSKRTTEVVKL
jgi:hypothetical protein